ncbi:MAG: glycosyltransferase family 4 protein [Nocardioides alkalitolerans]
MHGTKVVFLSWRDATHPEAGGAERYLRQVAAGLAERGADVTVFSAATEGRPTSETVDGVRLVRAGSRTTVYLHGLWALLRGRLGRPDVVVDVQNGIPFLARLVTRRPVVVLVHHVHREQWPVIFPGLAWRLGWWIESRLSPWIYRRDRYVTVSRATRDELVRLGVDASRVSIVRNGCEPPLAVATPRSPTPLVCVVGRLVPHKQVEHAIEAVAALRPDLPDLRLVVVGDGWWSDELVDLAEQRGISDAVDFLGYVDERTKHEVYAASWVMALPSLKEGWGIVVSEAGAHGVPTVAYADAGGTTESVHDGESGILADDRAAFVEALRRVLTDPVERRRLSDGARAVSAELDWIATEKAFADVLRETIEGR